MSLTLVSEMLRSEVKRLALSSVKDQNTLRNRISESGRIFDFEDTNSQAHQNHNNNYGSSAKEITDGMFASSRPISHGTSHCVSTQHTPDLPCMNLFGDLQTSVQQLGLFVEMGLILGKITSGLSVLSDGTYESILCDILKTYEKVRLLTERIGRSQNVVWAIDRTNLTNGLHYSHPDVLMFVLISVLTQLLPHSDFIRVKGTFVSVEEVSRTLEDESDLLAVNAVIESVAPVVVIGNVGLLVTEIEAFGDTANLAEIVSKLTKTPEDSERTSSAASQTSSNAATSDDGKLVARFDEFINPDVEEFGGSVFALGNLLDNVLGGSTYLPTDTGCIFSFSIPCRIEAKTPTIPEETSEDASMASSRSMNAPSSSRYLNMQDDEESVRAVITKEEIASIMKNGSGSDNDSDRSSEKEDVPEISALSVPSIKIPPRPPSPARIIIKEPIVVPQSTDPIIVVSNNFRDSVVMSPATETDKVVKDQVLETIQTLKSRATEHDRHRMLQVLLVDDSISVQKILKVWLSKNHCNVTTALNGAVALDLMKVNVYDIIFMDFLMPVMDGLTCIRLFKEFCQGKQDTYTSSPKNQPPTCEFIDAIKESWIVGLSATALPEDQEMAFSLGMHVFCTKPVDMQALKILLEAKRLRLPYLTIQQLASSNRELSMTTVQRDLAVDLMLPYPNTSPSSSNEATHTVTSPATSGKLLKDRSELKDAFNQLETGKANIFGSFYFNNNNNSMQ
jgi:CheY-like chemotaxis protein